MLRAQELKNQFPYFCGFSKTIAAGDLRIQVMLRLKLVKVCNSCKDCKILLKFWGFFNSLILFSKLRRAEIFSLATWWFSVILMDALHHCFCIGIFPLYLIPHFLFYFCLFWDACPLVLFSSFSYHTSMALLCLWSG